MYRGRHELIDQKYHAIEHQLPTAKGCSGAPIFVYYLHNQTRVLGIVGMHLFGKTNIGINNMGLLFTEEMYGAFELFRTELGLESYSS